MPIIENKLPGEPDEMAASIARALTASPSEYLSDIHDNLEFCRFMWLCLYMLIEEVGYVEKPKAGSKTIVCYVPLGSENDPNISPTEVEALSRALKSVFWETDVERRGKKLFYRLEGVLSATDEPHLGKRCILPTPAQFSHMMKPENEGLTRLIWMFGDNVLHSRKTFALGAHPEFWLPKAVLVKAIEVYQARGWNVNPMQKVVGRKTLQYLNITLPAQKSLPAPGDAQ